jgi:hypothetical protein
MWFLFRVPADPPLAKWLRMLRDLVRRKDWPVPRAHVPSVEPRRQAAEAAGLSQVTGERTVEGRTGDLAVSLRDRPGVAGTLVEIRGLMSGLRLSAEGLESAFQKRMGMIEMEVGDDDLDRALFVLSHGWPVRAVLDADLRRRIVRAFGGRLRDDSRWAQAPPVVRRLRIEGGTLTAELHDTTAPGADALEVSLAGLLQLARGLQPERATVEALARNASSDPVAGVRLQCLRALVREHPGDEATEAVLAGAEDDESQQVRLEAAVARGPAGRPALLGLAAEGWTDDAVAAHALDALGPHVPPERAQAVLEHALRTERHATAAAGLRALGRGGGSASPLVWRCAAHDRPEISLAALETLGAVGTAGDVPRLRELEEHGARPLASAARQAIASIQARLPGASPGQLTLAADAGGGRVSLPDAAGGRVSLDRPKG